jgi:hypothetical protein
MPDSEEINRLAEMMTNNREEQPVAQEIKIRQTAITARIEGGVVTVRNADKTELFKFNAAACPFSEDPIYFLLEIYTIGFTKGKFLGKELTKARIREILGDEL